MNWEQCKDQVAYKLYKTDYKYIGLDICKVEVLEQAAELYADSKAREALQKDNEFLLKQEVIHLYLGCKIVGTYNDTSGSEGILTGVTNGGEECEIQFFLEDGINVEEEPQFNEAKEVKLILRPLSSMTEEEMKELYFLVFSRKFSGDNITHRDAGKSQERWILWSGVDRLFIYKDGDVGADCDLSYIRVPYQKVFTWQLSRGFDLFGLIEAGLAINSESFKPSIKQ